MTMQTRRFSPTTVSWSVAGEANREDEASQDAPLEVDVPVVKIRWWVGKYINHTARVITFERKEQEIKETEESEGCVFWVEGLMEPMLGFPKECAKT